MSTYAELKKASTDAATHKADTATALTDATTADNHAAADVTATATAYAAAVFAAPGHTVVYTSPLPITIDQSTDGVTVTSVVIAGSGDNTDGTPVSAAFAHGHAHAK